MGKVAILIDGGFFQKRANHIWKNQTPQERVKKLMSCCRGHLGNQNSFENNELYRIFYYDCPPIAKKIYHPYLQKQIDLSKSDQYKWNTEFLQELRKQRKFALRLGELAEEQAYYTLNQETVKLLCKGAKQWNDITENDFFFSIKQKGVDMKIGIDIASMAYKKQVEKIVLIAGDSDFVPAAKLARREGIDFILDPMWSNIKPKLFEHIDGLKSYAPKPERVQNNQGPFKKSSQIDSSHNIHKTTTY